MTKKAKMAPAERAAKERMLATLSVLLTCAGKM